MLTQERLKEILKYDQETGYFSRKTKTKRMKIGESYIFPNNGGYLSIGIDGKTYNAHTLVFLYMTGCFSNFYLDHINCIKHDNRWINLREATHAKNLQNIIKPNSNNKSGYLGVSWSKSMKKYEACIRVDN